MKLLKKLAMIGCALSLTLGVYALQPSAQEAAGGGDVVYEGGGLGGVTFSHDNHLASEGATCASCHPDTFAMTSSEPGTLTMEAINGGAECGTCHNDTGPGFAASDCMTCHIR